MAEHVSYQELLRDLAGLTVTNVVCSDHGWVVEANGQDTAICPGCAESSRSRHSRYRRRIRDLPLRGLPVTLHLRMGRWFCRNRQCDRRVFTERLADVLAPYARQSQHLADTQTAVGRALGGRPAARLLRRLGMPASRDTVVRRVKQAAARAVAERAVRVLGVDDWAWVKGDSYGTILVDLERNEVVDVLPTRSAEALRVWLTEHPGVEVIGRDRQGLYAEGARLGAPEAIQVADRFHLQLNLRQALERELAVRRRHLRLGFAGEAAPGEATSGDGAQTTQEKKKRSLTARELAAEAAHQRRQQKLELFEAARLMKAAGFAVTDITAQLGVTRRQLDQWAQLAELPERNCMEPRPGALGFFGDYLRQRWDAGLQNARVLFTEIQELGYRGSYSHMARFVAPWRQPAPPAPAHKKQPLTAIPVLRQISPLVAAALLGKHPEELSDHQAATVAALKQQCPEFALMRKLALSFRTILQRGKVATLHAWMEEAAKSGMDSLQRFVRTLKRDLPAVEAAVREPWSNGPVEGQVNRLKTLKRQMYGRAGVELLRARLLPEAAAMKAAA